VTEPLGGSHRAKEQAIAALGDAVERALQSMLNQDGTTLREQRRDKFLEMGRRGLTA
jgi:acetyl-CoA carboxylase carboxyl transferase subunit alpha